MSVKTAIPLPLEALREFCQRHGIVRLEVFGSILRDDFGPESDIDFIYTLGPDAPKPEQSWGVELMEHELAEILGRPVDLIRRSTAEGMRNWLRRQAILESAEVLIELPKAA